ncbi:MAG: PepSY domain-containing protein [Acidobacteriota bacterium]|nr:PepSY domain-containing protein [Acidobacteriota bacterium]
MKKLKLFAVATFVVAFLVGLSFATSLKAQESKESKSNDPRVLAGVAKVTMLDAVVAATKEAPGVVTKAELEREKGQLIYSFDILPSPRSQKITEVHIDALTGKVLAKEEEKLNKGEDEEQEEKEEAAGEEEEQNLSELIPAVKISMAQAIKTALADSPGFVLSGELEKENGKIIYSFDILPSPRSREISEIQVDVATGQIVAREKEEIK